MPVGRNQARHLLVACAGGHFRDRALSRWLELSQDRQVRSREFDGIERIGTDKSLGFLDLGTEIVPSDNLFNGAERICTAVPCINDRSSETGQQTNFAIDGAFVALQRSLAPALRTPEHLSAHPFEHHHGIVSQGDLHFGNGGSQNGPATDRVQDG